MIGGIQVKICGLTSPGDAAAAAGIGVDYLGFNFYPKSPRGITLSSYQAMIPNLPKGKRVAVLVEPSETELGQALAAGFDFFQIHFRHDLPQARLEDWSRTVGKDRLWLAPKLPPSVDVAREWLPLASYFLLDTFNPATFGGSGRTGDWAKFSRHLLAHPDRHWILSGGLSPSNASEALRQSGAQFLDVNSGVESAPGVKDSAKLQAFARALRG